MQPRPSILTGETTSQGRDGSNNVVQQFIHGTQSLTRRLPRSGSIAERSVGFAHSVESRIDELVMVRAKDKGDLYIHQDANWNVIALTDLGGNLVERYVYEPYGQFVAHQVTSFGDRDGDLDVDATDKGTPGTTCTGTVSGSCRILDLDFDGDYDASDGTLFDALDAGIARHPARTFTGVAQPFAHQGLLFEPELGSYQNRARQYDPEKRRFSQRDPISATSIFFELQYAGYSTQDATTGYSYVESNPLLWRDPTGLTLDQGPGGYDHCFEGDLTTMCKVINITQTGGGCVWVTNSAIRKHALASTLCNIATGNIHTCPPPATCEGIVVGPICITFTTTVTTTINFSIGPSCTVTVTLAVKVCASIGAGCCQ